MTEKLDRTIIVRLSASQKRALEKLCAAYGLKPAQIARLQLQHAIDTWSVPGLMQKPKPKP